MTLTSILLIAVLAVVFLFGIFVVYYIIEWFRDAINQKTPVPSDYNGEDLKDD